MIVGAYQFAVTGCLQQNMQHIQNAISQAASQNVELLIFPECALTGYPPRDIERADMVDFDALTAAYEQLQMASNANRMHLVVGTIVKEDNCCYNCAAVFSPNEPMRTYYKRALWGWDADNFCPGNEKGIIEINGFKVGIRICFEVRFPEYFRELYLERTDLNLILFYDVSDYDDVDRYQMIKAHICTRAVENVCYTLSVDTIRPYQTAPTALFDRSGYPLVELERNAPELLVYDLKKMELDFGERGRKIISDSLLGM